MKIPPIFQNLFQNFKNIIEKVQKMPPKDINTWKTVLIVLICVDLFGVYWFLKQKTLGGGILVVLIIILAFLLFFSRKNAIPAESTNPKPKVELSNDKPEVKGGLKQKMPEENEETEVEAKELEEDSNSGFDLGLPDSSEYNKRLGKALGSFEDFGI